MNVPFEFEHHAQVARVQLGKVELAVAVEVGQVELGIASGRQAGGNRAIDQLSILAHEQPDTGRLAAERFLRAHKQVVEAIAIDVARRHA